MKSMRTLEVIEAVSAGIVEIAQAVADSVQKAVKATTKFRFKKMRSMMNDQIKCRRQRMTQIELEYLKLEGEMGRLEDAAAGYQEKYLNSK
ncbi:hypothetical protein [Anaeroselena agilis]|uniref:Uncharacterized protein n=1 Tax=Anaeroselena agilis TaxID=3063788 RepID=A0ABU3NUZ2_9FIRM|nr:hypothetical protein [Selenomonadales bacterium 4137-cl]